MAEAVAIAVAKVGAFFAKHAVLKFFAQVAASVLLGTLTEKLFGKKAPRTSFAGVKSTKRGSLEPRRIVYGRAQVGGVVSYNNVRGTDNEWLDFEIAHVDHLADAVSFFIDNKEIPIADIDYTPPATDGPGGTGPGTVSTAEFVRNSVEALRITWYPGFPNQPANSLKVSQYTEQTTAHRLRGVFNAWFSLLYTQDVADVWKTGFPQRFSVLLDGRRLYDSRKDSTNGGAGTHRYTDDTTWEWSDNPALCIADYLFVYMDADPAQDIDWPSVAAAADDCDVSVSIPGTPTTEKRFTCNGAFLTDENHEAILVQLKESMAGRLIWTGGEWTMYAGVYQTPPASDPIDLTWLAGDVNIRGAAPTGERFNEVTGFYVDPERDYQSVEFNAAINSSYVTRDAGLSLPFDHSLRFTNSEYMAQRISIRKLDQFDNQIIADLICNEKGAKIEPGLFYEVTLTEFSWTDKVFRCIGWEPTPSGNYKVTLKEDFSTRYTDPTVGEYTTRTLAGVIVPPGQIVPPPTSLATTGKAGVIELNWENPPARLFAYVEIHRSLTDDVGTAVAIAQQRSDVYLDAVNDTQTYYYWIRAVSHEGTQSVFEPITTAGVSGVATSAGTDGLSVFVGNVFLRKSTAPTEPVTDDGSYNFTTNVLTPPSIIGGSADDWSITVPAGSDPLYVSTGSFEISGPTGTDTTVDWTAPVILASDGGDGLSIIVANVYLRKATAPTEPIDDDGSYNFTTKVLIPPSTGGGSADNWFTEPPAGSDPLYSSTGSFDIVGTTGTDNTVDWTAPAILVQDGADGSTGPQGDAGRDGVVVAGIKENTSTFAGADGSDPGEMYVHGLDSSGAPADVDGSLLYNGVVETVPKGIVWTSQTNSQGFLILDTSGTGFAIPSQSNADIVAAKLKIDSGGSAVWEYDNNVAWTSLTPTADMLVIGTYEVQTAENIYQAVLSSAIALSTLIIRAGRIETAQLSAITATIGTLETRPIGGSPTTPRLVLTNSDAPMQIFADDDSTLLFSLTDVGGELELYLLGEFASGTIDTGGMFSLAGIEDLRGRLGITIPAGATGGTLTIPGQSGILPATSTNTQLLDPTPPEIEHGTDDITLTFQFYDFDQGTGTAPTVGNWTVHWEVNIDSGGWVDIATASFTFSGTIDEYEEGSDPPVNVWEYLLSVTKIFVYTPGAGTDFEFRMNSIKNSGTHNAPRYLSASANEPIVGSTGLDDHGDVDLTGAADNDLLYRSGGNWIDSAGLLTWDTTKFQIDGVVSMLERASAPSDVTAYGQFWVRNDAPNTPMFTTDTGVDIDLSAAGLANIVADTSPQLGGDLDSNTFDIDMLDNDFVTFGTSRDIAIGWDGVDLEITGLVSGSIINFRDNINIRIWNSGDTDYLALYHDGTDAWIDGLNNRWLRIGSDFDRLQLEGGVFAAVERASAPGDTASVGQFWVRNDVPNTPMFTDDTGIDFDLSADTVYSHPNHTGHVTSSGDGAQTLVVAAITGQTALTSGLVGTDELLVSDGGVIKRMDVSVMNAYFDANLDFAATGHGHAFDDLSDVNLAGAVNNDLLYRSGGNWIDTAGALTFDGSTFVIATGIDKSLEIRGQGANNTSYMTWESSTGGAEYARVGIVDASHDLTIRSLLDGVTIDADGASGQRITLRANLIGGVYIAGSPLYIQDDGETDYININHDGTDTWFDGLNNRWLRVSADFDRFQLEGGVFAMVERASAPADTATVGQIWVKTASPNELWFTNDVGTDFQLGVGGGVADGTVTDSVLRWSGSAWVEETSAKISSAGVITGQRFITGSNSVATITDILITDNGNIGALDSLNFIIDTENTTTGNMFKWLVNAPGETGAFTAMSLQEDGDLIGVGTLTGFTDYAGILAANLLDKSVAEIIGGNLWNFTYSPLLGFLLDVSTTVPDTVGDSGTRFNYMASGASPKPSGWTDASLITMSYSALWQTQIAADWRQDGLLAVRGQNSGAWSSWHEIPMKDVVTTITANWLWDVSTGGPHLHVKGGSGGASLGRFERDIGATAYVDINASGGEPQIVFDRNAGTTTWYMGQDAADRFVIGDGAAVNSNDFLIINNVGDLFVGGDSIGHFKTMAGTYGSVSVAGVDGAAGWEGYDINSEIVFMSHISENRGGIYAQGFNYNGWALQYNRQGVGETEIYYRNAIKLGTHNTGIDVTGKIISDTLFLNERAAADSDVTADGQLWVKNDGPNTFWFTDDVGSDKPIGHAAYNVSANQSYNMNSPSGNGSRMMSGAWYSDNATAYTLTLSNSTNTEFPVNGQMTVWNEGSGTLTINEGTGMTLYLLDGSAVTDTAGGCTMGIGGYATIIKKSTTVWLIMGAGVSA